MIPVVRIILIITINLLVNVAAAPGAQTTIPAPQCDVGKCAAALGVPAGSCIRAWFEEGGEDFWQNGSCATLSFNSIVNPPKPCIGCIAKLSGKPPKVQPSSSASPTGPAPPGATCNQVGCGAALGFNIAACSRLAVHKTGVVSWNRASCVASTVGNLVSLPPFCRGCWEDEWVTKAESFLAGHPVSDAATRAANADGNCDGTQASACVLMYGTMGVTCARTLLPASPGTKGYRFLSCGASAMNLLNNPPAICKGCTIKKEVSAVKNGIEHLFGLGKSTAPSPPPSTPTIHLKLPAPKPKVKTINASQLLHPSNSTPKSKSISAGRLLGLAA